MKKQCLSDFVKELVANLHHEKIKMPFDNERPWHELFYDLRRHKKAPSYLGHLRFDWDGPYPHSRELSDFLHALHWNASVSANNPSFDEISLADDVAELWYAQVSKLKSSESAFLKIASEEAKIKFA